MKTAYFYILSIMLLMGLLFFSVCKQIDQKALPEDPILAMGHGDVIASDGESAELTAEFIRSVQEIYIERLCSQELAAISGYSINKDVIEDTRREIYIAVSDTILANALFLDWLLENTEPEQKAKVTSVNNGLRWHYVLNIQANPVLPIDGLWAKGIIPEVAKKLEPKLGITIFFVTNKGGEDYCNECLANGVPIPEFMFGSEWELVGEIQNEFLSDGLRAELWIHESQSPDGICLALPRFPSGEDRATLFGVICLGKTTSKVCFFDNPPNVFFKRGEVIDFKRFNGGVDLVPNEAIGGVCSDCHAGENPYVVHPDKPAFASIINKIQSNAWYDPLVAASWPQNPGPSNLLDAVPSTSRCDACHIVGSAGRFPEVSTQLPQYCATVLETAVGPVAKRTMPRPGGSTVDLGPYMSHVNALKNACSNPPSGSGVEVDADYPEDKNYISPPIVIDPLYQCATQVAVRGAVLDAEVFLLVNGSVAVPSISPARNTQKLVFSGLNLTVGDIVTARQEKDGASSVESPPVTVRDHTVDYPSGLPAPTIDPSLMYECAELIAIRHVPGAKLTVFTNGGDPVSYGTSTGWTAVRPGKIPFAVGDRFEVEISLCSDVSPLSSPEMAAAAPPSLSQARFVPEEVYVGQEMVSVENLTNGTQSEVGVAGMGSIGAFSTPISWYPEFDIKTGLGRPLMSGESLWITQKLCDLNSKSDDSPRAKECSDLPAPRIQHPIVGANFVVVTQAVPGARILVYDDVGVEIGDGSGTVILLNRTLTGTDILTVVQKLGECISRKGYRISVRNPRSTSQETPNSE